MGRRRASAGPRAREVSLVMPMGASPRNGRWCCGSLRRRLGAATHEQSLDRLVDGAPLVLVGLVAAHEVDPAFAALDRAPHESLEEDDAGRQIAGLRIDAGVVVED